MVRVHEASGSNPDTPTRKGTFAGTCPFFSGTAAQLQSRILLADYSVISSKNARQYTKYCLRFLIDLTKNLLRILRNAIMRCCLPVQEKGPPKPAAPDLYPIEPEWIRNPLRRGPQAMSILRLAGTTACFLGSVSFSTPLT